MTSKAIRLQLVFVKKNIEDDENQIFFSEKIRYSGNWIQDYAHSFFGEDF